MAKGSVVKRCGCTQLIDGKRRQVGRSCPRLRRADGSWNPRHGTWAYSITVPGVDGKPQRVGRTGFATQAEAQAELDSVREKAARGHAVNVRVTVGEYLDEWLASKSDIRTSTRRGYEGHIRRHLRPALGHLRLDGLRVAHVAEALTALSSSNANKQRVRATLRAALSDAVRQGLISSNPAALVKLPSGKAPKGLVWTAERIERYEATGEMPSPVMLWTPAQAGVFLDATAEDRLYGLWHLVAHLGLRRGEACGLEWQDVDLAGQTLTVRLSRVGLNSTIIEEPPKSEESHRTIALDGETTEVLRAHRKAQLAERLALGPAWTESGKVFTAGDGQALDPAKVSSRFVSLAAEAGLPPIRLHDLRHGAATFALAAGADMKTVSTLLGHSTVALTADVYASVLPEVARSAAEATASLIKRSRKAQ